MLLKYCGTLVILSIASHMTAEITIRNYRNIPYNNPITLIIGNGITFILGINNIGKSNLLKLFYELREGGHLHGGGFSFKPANLYYSAVKNQQSPQKEIILELKAKSRTYVLELTPHSPGMTLDHPNCNANLTHKAIVESEFNINELNYYRELFQNSMYVGSFRTTTFQTSADYFDVKIGQSFIQAWDEWSTGSNLEHKKKIAQLKEELRELFGFKKFDIYSNQNNTNLNIETDDGFFTLDELGGGISHFILVLGNALIRQPSFILIDEPESALHPKMQEVFVRTLAFKARYGLIASSHSIGLARSVGSDRIYSLSKDQSGRLSLTPYGDFYKPSIVQAIHELGYSQFVELGGNNILLVEGVTDIKCFKEILRKYGIDQDFIVLDLGGAAKIGKSRFDELNELKRLNAKSYSVIIDSERTSADAELRSELSEFVEMCRHDLGFHVFVTEYHSTDNYLTQNVVAQELGGGYHALGPYENLNSRSESKWGKSLNWKMFRAMKKEDFAETKLHDFITEVLMPLSNHKNLS